MKFANPVLNSSSPSSDCKMSSERLVSVDLIVVQEYPLQVDCVIDPEDHDCSKAQEPKMCGISRSPKLLFLSSTLPSLGSECDLGAEFPSNYCATNVDTAAN